MIRLSLPWPHRDLHPNARVHFMRKAKRAKQARSDAFYTAKAAGADVTDATRLDVALEFHAPDARRRDTDGMLSSCKAYLDGISDALGVDDSNFNLSIRRGDIVRDGRVIINISEAHAS